MGYVIEYPTNWAFQLAEGGIMTRKRKLPAGARRLARSVATRRHKSNGSAHHPPNVERPRGLNTRPRPLPLPGNPPWSLEDIQDVWSTFSIDGSPEGTLDAYHGEACGLVLHTWNLVRNEKGRCLELGSNPFFLTWLLRNFTDLDLVQANYFGETGKTVQELTWRDSNGLEHANSMSMDLFNMESETFPYADETFDVILFCEVIEHLLDDPLRALREIHRILKPSGLLVVTTPDVGRLRNLFALMEGRNIYDPYSGFGPYGRHNREFTPHELDQLLRFAGFTHEQIFTEDSCIWDRDAFQTLESALVKPLAGPRSHDLGQYIFAVAGKTGTPQEGWPEPLFRSRTAGEIVPWT